MIKGLGLFSSAGGACVGYHRAGIDMLGVDIAPQPNYPFEFVQADAFAFLADHGDEFDFIHASPECRGWTALQSVAGKGTTGWQLPRIIEMLDELGKPYVVENVITAQFDHDLVLCGEYFGLRTVRHRKFRIRGFTVPQPAHPKGHVVRTSTKKRITDWNRGMHISVTGDVTPWIAAAAMGIDWPMTGDELSQAIPPAYTEYIGGLYVQSRENVA